MAQVRDPWSDKEYEKLYEKLKAKFHLPSGITTINPNDFKLFKEYVNSGYSQLRVENPMTLQKNWNALEEEILKMEGVVNSIDATMDTICQLDDVFREDIFEPISKDVRTMGPNHPLELECVFMKCYSHFSDMVLDYLHNVAQPILNYMTAHYDEALAVKNETLEKIKARHKVEPGFWLEGVKQRYMNGQESAKETEEKDAQGSSDSVMEMISKCKQYYSN